VFLKRLCPCLQSAVFWCVTGPLTAWKVEVEQWTVDWGQNLVLKAGVKWATESRNAISLGNRVSQEQGSQGVFPLPSPIGWEQRILSVRNIEWYFRVSSQSGAGVVKAVGSRKLGALRLTSWSAVAVCYLGQVCFPLSACLSSCVTQC